MNITKQKINTFDKDVAYQLVSNNQLETFCVDFDGLWQWCDYTRKDSAKKKLIKHFEEGVDYQVRQIAELRPQGGYSNREEIELTLDCAKSFAMMAGTSQGKEVRRYFIEAEKQYRQLLLTNKMYEINSVSKSDLDSMKQDIINEIRSTSAPVNRLDSAVKEATSKLLEAMKKLKELQPRTNQILSVIPSGYLSYAEFKQVHNYGFKRGTWKIVERNLNSSKVIEKSPLNSIKYYEEQEVIDTINDLNVSGDLKVEYGATGTAKKQLLVFNNMNDQDLRMVFFVRKDLKMPKGKIAAQVGHAVQYLVELALEEFNPGPKYRAWSNGIATKICLKVSSEAELEAFYELGKELNFSSVKVEDEGLTCFDGVKTLTVVGWGPLTKEEHKEFTKDLSLL